jgi:hypothetical protein
MRRILHTLLMLLVFAGCLGGAALLQHHHILKWRQRGYEFRDALYLPSSAYVRAVAVGYDQFAADFLWLRMIQTFAASWTVPQCAPQMQEYFRVISDLDPKFVDPYNFALMGVGEEGKRYDFVREIVEKSMYKIPGNSSVTYQGAFFANWNMNDQNLAKYYVRMAKLDPNYPEFIDRWEGYFDLKQGRFRAAYEKYLTDYVHAIVQNNPALYGLLDRNLRHAIDSWFKSEIKNRAIDWQKEKGKFPTLEELVAAGKFKGVELPDVMLIEKLITGLQELPAKERAAQFNDEMLTKFTQTAVHAFDGLPPGPFDIMWPEDAGYTIWLDNKPADERFVLSKLEALNLVRQMAQSVTGAATAFREKHNGKAPELKDILPPESGMTTDPFNQPWVWDVKTSTLGTTKYPDIAKQRFPEL